MKIENLIGQKCYLIKDNSQKDLYFWSLLNKCDEDEEVVEELVIRTEDLITHFDKTDIDILLEELLRTKLSIKIQPLKRNDKEDESSEEMYDKNYRFIVVFDDNSRLYYKTRQDAEKFAENELKKYKELNENKQEKLLVQHISLIGNEKEFERVFEELDGLVSSGCLNDYEIDDCKDLYEIEYESKAFPVKNRLL